MNVISPKMADDLFAGASLSKSLEIPRPGKVHSPTEKTQPSSVHSRASMNYGSIQREEESESQFGRTDNISMSSMLSPTERKRYTSEDYSIVSDSIFHSQEGDRPEVRLAFLFRMMLAIAR